MATDEQSTMERKWTYTDKWGLEHGVKAPAMVQAQEAIINEEEACGASPSEALAMAATVREVEGVQVHRFDSTGEAYDATQTESNIFDGDVVVVETEGVVGILVSAWPVAVTPEAGELHSLGPDVSWDDFEDGRYAESAKVAREKAEWVARKREGAQVAELLAPLPVGFQFYLPIHGGGRAYRALYRKNTEGLWDQQPGTCEAPHVVNMDAAHLGFCVGADAIRQALVAAGVEV